jgi:two-component system, chemotaxis family, chemotaxis protein CheY
MISAADPHLNAMAKRILIVDDNPAIRRIVRFFLEKHGLEICGEAGDGLEALDQAPRLKPDIVLLDFSMPRMNGLDAARKLKFQSPERPIVMLTLHKDDYMTEQAHAAGVDAVVAKSDSLTSLFEQLDKL